MYMYYALEYMYMYIIIISIYNTIHFIAVTLYIRRIDHQLHTVNEYPVQVEICKHGYLVPVLAICTGF